MSGVSSTRRLRRLLTGAKADHKLTLDKIVEQSGERLKRSTAENLLKQKNRSEPLNRDTMEAIADGFGLPYEAVRVAHLTDMGLLTSNYDSALEAALRLSPVLSLVESEMDREIVLAVARATAATLTEMRRPGGAVVPLHGDIGYPLQEVIFEPIEEPGAARHGGAEQARSTDHPEGVDVVPADEDLP